MYFCHLVEINEKSTRDGGEMADTAGMAKESGRERLMHRLELCWILLAEYDEKFKF